jgi:hypothetical protein
VIEYWVTFRDSSIKQRTTSTAAGQHESKTALIGGIQMPHVCLNVNKRELFLDASAMTYETP